jgi:hypothetical protein
MVWCARADGGGELQLAVVPASGQAEPTPGIGSEHGLLAASSSMPRQKRRSLRYHPPIIGDRLRIELDAWEPLNWLLTKDFSRLVHLPVNRQTERNHF